MVCRFRMAALLFFIPLSIHGFPLPPDNLTLSSLIFPPSIIYRNLGEAPSFIKLFREGPINPKTMSSTAQSGPKMFQGPTRIFMGALGVMLILITGLMAGLTLGVMSNDSTKLKMWTRTGEDKRRVQAQRILNVRKHPNWLFVSLVLANVMVAEGLPLILTHLFTPGAWTPFWVSTACVALFGQLIPQAIMPMFILKVAGRLMWLVKGIMWIIGLPAYPCVFALQHFKKWRNKGLPFKMDGILYVEELVEFVGLHEIREGLGGQLRDEVGNMVTRLISHQGLEIGREVKAWEELAIWDFDGDITDSMVESITSGKYSYIIVVRYDKEDMPREGLQEIVGAVVVLDVLMFQQSKIRPQLVKELDVVKVLIVQEHCLAITVFLSLMSHFKKGFALVVPTSNEFPDSSNRISLHSPAKTLSPLGIIELSDVWSMFGIGRIEDIEERNEEPNAEPGDVDNDAMEMSAVEVVNVENRTDSSTLIGQWDEQSDGMRRRSRHSGMSGHSSGVSAVTHCPPGLPIPPRGSSTALGPLIPKTPPRTSRSVSLESAKVPNQETANGNNSQTYSMSTSGPVPRARRSVQNLFENESLERLSPIIKRSGQFTDLDIDGETADSARAVQQQAVKV